MGEFSWDKVPVKTGATADPAAQTNPAAITVTKRWLLKRLYISYVSDANVANRYCSLSITDGTNEIFAGNIIPPQTASLTCTHNFGQTPYVNATLVTNNWAYMPELELEAGSVITLTFSNKAAADNAGPLRYFYHEATI